MKKTDESIKKTVLYYYNYGVNVKYLVSRYKVSKITIYRWTQKKKNISHSVKKYDDYLKLDEAYNELLNNYNMLIDLHYFKDSSLEEKKIAVERCRDKYPYTKLCDFIELLRSTYLYYHNSYSFLPLKW